MEELLEELLDELLEELLDELLEELLDELLEELVYIEEIRPELTSDALAVIIEVKDLVSSISNLASFKPLG